MDARVAALDLAADASAVLQAAEVALLTQRYCKKRVNSLLGEAPRHAPQPTAATSWLGCVSQGLREAAIAEARLLVTYAGGGWTHWIENTATPRCALEALALAAKRFHLPRLGAPAASVGTEWWVQVRDMDESMPMHWDCDEELYGRTGEHASPSLATVTYMTSSGPPTVVLPVATDARGRGVVEPRHEGGDGHGAYASFPVAGKHLAFDGRLLHGTVHEGGPWSPTRRAAYADGLGALDPRRITVLVNLWIGHRPADVAPLAAETATALWVAPRRATAADGPACLAADAFATAQPSPAVRVGSAAASTAVRELSIGSFHGHAPIRCRHLGHHLSRPPAPGVHFVRVAHAQAMLLPEPEVEPPPLTPTHRIAQ